MVGNISRRIQFDGERWSGGYWINIGNTGLGGMIDICQRERTEIILLFYTSGGAAFSAAFRWLAAAAVLKWEAAGTKGQE